MDDAPGATLGQVQQRKERGGLKGFNDSGWQIPRGNYERFITQINPDENNVAWWRVDWPEKKPESEDNLEPEENLESEYKLLNKYSRFARGLRNKGDRIDLRVNKKFYEETTPIKVKLIYFDKGEGSFALKYDSDKEAYTLKKENSGEWLTKEFIISDAAFNNHGDIPDISLVNMDDEDSIFHMVEIEKLN